MQDFHLLEASQAVDAASLLHADASPDHHPLFQYHEHQMFETRPAYVPPDIGAFELPEPGIDAGLAAGLAALAVLSRRRSRSRG
jgi:hypothetical protein